MKPYEIIEHTADIGLKANGATLKKLFENAAKGMFEIIKGKESQENLKLQNSKKIEIKREVKDFEELLVTWLSEILYIFNKEEILFKNFNILKLDNDKIVAEAFGEKIDLSKNTLQTEIKAVTFHNLKIEKNIKGFSCNVIFDV